MTPEEETAWLAGILEGEGCFARASGVMVILQMTDQDIVERAAALMGASRMTVVEREGCKPLYSVKVYGDVAEALMRRVRPLLGSRRGARVDELLALRASQAADVEVICPVCEEAFLRSRAGRGFGAARVYCSARCKQQAKNLKRRQAA